MKAILYGIGLQFKLDIRSKTLLVTCYLVPLLFFMIMSGIFTSLMPDAKLTLIQSMTIMGVSMGALIGVPPSMVEIYSTNIKKMYSANNVPLYFGIFTIVISAFIHLMIMSFIIFIAAPIIFHASTPDNIPLYFWLFCTKCGWILIVTEGYLLYLSNKTRLFEHKKTIWYFS